MKDTDVDFIIPKGLSPDAQVISKVKDFLRNFKIFELENKAPLLLYFDKKSEAYYLICHLDSKQIVTKSDLDAVLDPRETEDYKLNRDIYTDTYAYKVMQEDALKGRGFEDLVVEFDVSYKSEKPLKVFGGQHRITAINEALKNDVVETHGVRVYYGLSIEQKVDIALANNTSIAISNDFLDRVQEDLLGNNLRQWCQSVGLLREGQNFSDRRSPEGVPTVRLARTLIVNFYKGKGEKKEGLHIPKVCSSGAGVDEDYKQIRDTIDWSDKNLKTMGEQFAKLHEIQRKCVLNRTEDKHIEFTNKAIHPCVAASWAYAAGLYQSNLGALRRHYELADSISGSEDPLNAKALSGARLKGVDPDTYRGLGARINNVELGRMLEVFMLQAEKAKERGVSLKLATAAIKSYQAKKAAYEADRELKKI